MIINWWSIRTLITAGPRRKLPLPRLSTLPSECTYREELYRGRRIILEGQRLSPSSGLSRMYEVLRTEQVIEKIREKREWIRPGLVASLGRMKRRQAKFDSMVKKTIDDINDVYRRIN